MRGKGQMLKIYLPVQPRGMAGGTAVGADDRINGSWSTSEPVLLGGPKEREG